MIDEKKLIEVLSRNSIFEKVTVGEETVYDIINRLPKVGEWIPCSERLPKRQDSKNTFLKMYLVCSKRGVVHMGFIDEDGIWRTIHGNRIYNEVAWMELPSPYNAERGGENE